MVANSSINKENGCSFEVWPLFLIAFLCIIVIQIRQITNLGYILLTTFIILAGFVIFTISTRERYLWLIALMPLEGYFKETYGIYISPYDIITIMILAELFLVYKFSFLKRKKESIIIIFLAFTVLLGSLLSPVSYYQPGLIMRLCAKLLIFLYGLHIFTNYKHFGQIIKALIITLPIFFFADLLMVADIIGSGVSMQNNVNVGVYRKIEQVHNISSYLAVAVSKNLINYLIISIPCMFAYKFFRRGSITIFIVLAIFVASAFMQSQTLFLVMVVDLLILVMFMVKRSKSKLRPIAFFAIIFFAVISIKPVENYLRTTAVETKTSEWGYNPDYETLTHEGGNELRWLAIISNLQAFIGNPILGLGMGNSTRRGRVVDVPWRISIYTEDTEEDSLSAHNTMLRVAAEFGLGGLIPYLLILYYCAKGIFTRRHYGKTEGVPSIYNSEAMYLILKLVFVNIFIYMCTHDIITSIRFWVVVMALSVWNNLRGDFSESIEDEAHYLCKAT